MALIYDSTKGRVVCCIHKPQINQKKATISNIKASRLFFSFLLNKNPERSPMIKLSIQNAISISFLLS